MIKMREKGLAFLFIFVSVLLLTACGGGSDNTSTNDSPTDPETELVSLSSLQVDPAAVFLPSRMLIGATVQLTVEGLTSDDETVDATSLVSWQSMDPDVVTVDSDGLVTAVGTGIARINAVWERGDTRLSSGRQFEVRNVVLNLSYPNPVSVSQNVMLTVSANWDDNSVLNTDGLTLESSDTLRASFDTPTSPMLLSTHAVGDITITARLYGVSAEFPLTIEAVVIPTYTIGGSITGLTGSGLEIINNGVDNKIIAANSTSFSFDTELVSGASYLVEVATQPSNPRQRCDVTQPGTTVNGANVTNISISCANSYRITGTISGLSGANLQIRNNNEVLDILPNAVEFAFSDAIAGDSYDIQIQQQPNAPHHTCELSRQQGDVVDADITNIHIECQSNQLHPRVQALSEEVIISWPEIGAGTFNAYYSTDPNCNRTNIMACANGGVDQGISNPHRITGLVNGQGYYFWLAEESGQVGQMSGRLFAQPNRLVTNGRVQALDSDASGNVYLGGEFTQVGAYQGGGYILRTLESNTSHVFPVVDGRVFTSIPDGSGGWYIGGMFDRVGGIDRQNIAHILADGSVDLDWLPAVNGSLHSMERVNGVLYLGGYFTQVAGETRNSAAAIDIDSVSPNYGQVTIWNPDVQHLTPGVNPHVYDIEVTSGEIILAGQFSQVGGEVRNNIASVSVSDGSLLAWDPDANGVVNTVALDGLSVYVGGSFNRICGQDRNYLASVSLQSSTNNCTTWAPAVSYNQSPATPEIEKIIILEPYIYVAGSFDTVNNLPRRGLVQFEFDSVSGRDAGLNGSVTSMEVSGDDLYIGGWFTSVAGKQRNHLARLNRYTLGADFWNPGAAKYLRTIAVSPDAVYVGGYLDFVSGVERNYLASIDSSGHLRDWNPSADRQVETIKVAGNRAYVGGQFSHINNIARSYIAAVDTITAEVADWDAQANRHVYSIDLDSNAVYVGGLFSVIGGQDNNYLAALDPVTGLAISNWSAPRLWGVVNLVKLNGNSLYVSSDSSNIGPLGSWVTRNGLAAFNADPQSLNYGQLLDWNPDVRATTSDLSESAGKVYSIDIQGDAMFVGGDFARINGVNRNNLARLSVTDGAVDSSWDPNVNRDVNQLVYSNGVVYIAGRFNRVGGLTGVRTGSVTAINSTSGAVEAWVPDYSVSTATIDAIMLANNQLYLGGMFTSFNSTALGGNFASLTP